MTLRAVMVGWGEPGDLQAGHGPLLTGLLRDTILRYPPDGEVPTDASPVPSCSVAVSRTVVEEAFAVEPWEDPPLASAGRIVCFEGPDGDDLARVSAAWQAVPGLTVLPVEVRERRYTSATIASVAYDRALGRQSRSEHPEALLWCFQRTPRWWSLSPLQRQTLLLPRLDEEGNVVSPGHVEVSEPLVSIVHRRLYHESLPGGEPGAMLGWFETASQHLGLLRSVVADLQDVSLTPDHAFYRCGPLWWGRRVPVQALLDELVGGA